MTVIVRQAFWHEGRQVAPGDRLTLAPDVAAFLAGRGLVQAPTILTTRGAA